MVRKINLGCGFNILEGYENYDVDPANDKVIQIDLNKLPLPFEDNSVDEILLFHVLEHLDINKFSFMTDIHRILKKGGAVRVKLPARAIGIDHTQGIHTKDYLAPLMGCAAERNRCEEKNGGNHQQIHMGGKQSSDKRTGLFSLMSYKRGWKIRDFFWKIKQNLETYLCTELEWKLKKK